MFLTYKEPKYENILKKSDFLYITVPIAHSVVSYFHISYDYNYNYLVLVVVVVVGLHYDYNYNYDYNQIVVVVVGTNRACLH